MFASGLVGAVSRGYMAKLEASGVDVGDWWLDGMLKVAGAFGLGAADMWGAGAENGYNEEERMIRSRAQEIDLNSQ